VVVPEAEDPDQKLFLPLKFNQGQRPQGLAYRMRSLDQLEQRAVLKVYGAHWDPPDRDRLAGQLFRIAWEGTVSATADAMMAEAAQALGIRNASFAPLVARHGLAAEGSGKARRFPRSTVEALLAHRSRGVGHGTAGYYAREVKAFTRWLARRRRIAQDPLADLQGATPDQSDHRHDWRTPTEAELRGVIAAAQASPRTFRGLDGRDRAILYATAAASGFRVEELPSLTPEAFDLVGDTPCVTLRDDVAKNGRTAVQPLPPDLAAALRVHLAGRHSGQPVWPGTWHEKGAAMLRRDLAAAGIPYATDGPEGPLYLDFHALRHGYVALLDKAGATL
jgi:integrase